MNCCFIPSCPKPANLACYEIPIDVQRREKWLTSINSDQNVLTIADEEIFSICSLHFKQSDYIYLIDDESSKRTISKDAVPSIFPWTCDWDSNYTAEMEVCEPNGNCSQQTDCSQTVAIVGLPEGETVQLGNVESLGINTRVSTEDETCLENSSAHTSLLDTGKLRNFLVTSIPSTSFNHVMQHSTSTSNATSRIETSEDEDFKVFNILPAKILYSCTECEFKSSDIISLKDHRTKKHPNQSLSGSMNMNPTVNSSLGLSESPKKENVNSPSNSSQSSGSVVRYRNEHGNRRLHKTRSSSLPMQDQITKNHSSDISTTTYNAERSRPSPSSASCSTSDCLVPPKRHVKNWYVCSTCSFRTPNAKKLKAHAKSHSSPPSSPHNEATKLPTSKHSEAKIRYAVSSIDRSDLKKLRLNGHTYYFCPFSNCSVRSKDATHILRHYSKTHFTLKIEKPTEPDTPNEEMLSRSKETDKLSLRGRHQLETKVENESMDGRERFSCKLCKFSCVKKFNLKLHEERHRKKASFQCKMCSYSVEGNRQLIFHETNHHEDGFPCSICDFKASTFTSRKQHMASVHRGTSSTKVHSLVEPSDLEHDIEHECSHCSFRTPSRERFIAHEKTHLPDIVESSTEELSAESESKTIKVETSTRKLKRKHEELEGSSSSSGTAKLIERLVYQCPLCSYWARTVTNFHQHFIAHEKTPAFKCSACDFSARSRRIVTRHIKRSRTKNHVSACWIMIKTIPENQYPEYLKTAHVPESSYSGKSLTPTNSIGERSVMKPSHSSDCRSSEFSAESNSDDDESDDESRDWIPISSFSSSNRKDSGSSSQSCVITLDGSSEEKTSSPCSFLTSESQSEESSENSMPSTAGSSSSFTGGIVLRSSAKKNLCPRRKRLRIESNESDNGSVQLPKREVKALTPSPSKNEERERGIQSIVDQKLEIKMQLNIPSRFPKGSFQILKALAKRRNDEKKISEMRQKINKMKSKQEKMKETDALSQSELLEMKGKQTIVSKQIKKLGGQKIEAELQVRTQQCQELKLSLAMYDPEQQPETNTEALADIKKLIAELEAKLALITKDISNLEEENDALDRQMKDTEESHAGAAQLFEILQSELSVKELELISFQEELAESNTRIAELVNNERKEITAVTEACEAELKKSYMKGLSEIRDRERELLDALEQFVNEKSDSAKVDESV